MGQFLIISILEYTMQEALAIDAVFAFLSVAITRTTSLINMQIEVMPVRIKIASVCICFLDGLNSGFVKLQNEDRAARTVHQLGEYWLSAIVSGLRYKLIAHDIGYDSKDEDPPSRVYSDGINGFSELIKQAQFVFSKDVYLELNNLFDLFGKYGCDVANISLIDRPLSDEEIGGIERFLCRNKELASKIDSEIKLDEIPKLCSLAMLKMLFSRRN